MTSSPGADDSLTYRDIERVRVGDMMRRDGIVLDCLRDGASREDTLITGKLRYSELRPGLHLHHGDVVEERPFTITSKVRPGLSCIFFLDGEIDIKCGDRRFAFKGDQRAMITGAAAIVCATPETFQRASLRRQHVRHLVVSATPEWLNLEGLAEMKGERLGAALLGEHLADHRVVPSPRVLELVREIFSPETFVPELQRLQMEGRAIQIIVETISAIMRVDHGLEDRGALGRHDRIRLQRAKDAISASPGKPWTVDLIAREAGISASGLQRLFRLSEGHSVFEYLRFARLARALCALRTEEATVQEASAIAGYTNPANFATAFKRKYGFTPREAWACRHAARG
jgi:AraC-like DNA-binding protein